MSNTSSFSTSVTYYPNGLAGSSVKASIPWTSSFDAVPAGSDLAVLQVQVGGYAPGLYVRNSGPNINPMWQLALTFDVLCADIGMAIQVIVRSGTVGPTNQTVYRNAQVWVANQVAADPNPVWVTVTGSGGGTALTSAQSAAGATAVVAQAARRLVGLDGFPLQPPSYTTTAVRALDGRLGTFGNAGLYTFHDVMELQQDFDGVQLLYANISTTRSAYFTTSVSVLPSTADMNNSGGTWVTGGTDGDITITIPPAETHTDASSYKRPSYRWSNIIPISSIPRTDTGSGGSGKPLLAVRSYDLTGNNALAVRGNGTDDFTNWATRTDGYLWMSRQQAGNFTGGTGFTSTTNISQTPLIAVRYYARGNVIATFSFLDSIGSGRATYLGESYAALAARQMSANLGVPVEYANFSWPGEDGGLSTGIGFHMRAMDAIRQGIISPGSTLFSAIGSPNDIPNVAPAQSVITPALINAQKYWLERMLSEALSNRIDVVLGTWMCTDPSVKIYQSTDALRRATNADAIARYTNVPGVVLADYDALAAGTIDGTGQMVPKAGFMVDGIHPSVSGNVSLSSPSSQASTTLAYGA